MSGKIEIAVIGAGRIGRVHLGNICRRMLDLVHIRWVCDLFIESDQAMKDWVTQNVPSDAKLITDFNICFADKSVTTVLCLTSTISHVEICKAAIAAGKKFIFCEKPVAGTLEEVCVIFCVCK
jgi:myo-inositol 2-dehydrogenase/D-chiro-inositol 1-dehydrogenase